MSAFDPKMEAALRASARSLLGELDEVVRQISRTADLDERLELSAWVCEGRRLLHGDEPPPASISAPANVRHLVAVGTQGPAFGARAGVQFAVGRRGLRSGALELPRSTADEFARANDLPLDGPEPA